MQQSNKNFTMDLRRVLLLLIIYFVVFLKLLPQIATKITLMIDPYATMMNVPVLLIGYCVVTCICIYIARPVWIPSVENFKKKYQQYIKLIVYVSLMLIVINFLLGMIIGWITQTTSSQNQEVLESNAMISPFFTFVYTCIFAPILEETIFRAGVYTYVKEKAGDMAALIISSLFFGMIHVSTAILIGNIQDLMYLIVYAGSGAILGYVYGKSENILVPITVHAGNNLLSFLLMLV